MGRSGTGLGMAVVWGTVSDHDGRISVGSAEGVGTTIEILLPATDQTEAGEAGVPPMADYTGDGETILVVDDVAEQREIAALMLRRLGYTVEAVDSGEAAVEHLRCRPADLVILDMIMDPGIDGLDTFRRIRRVNPGQRAIIASGYAETDRVKEALRLGASVYVKKPYTLEKLGTAVKAGLEGKNPKGGIVMIRHRYPPSTGCATPSSLYTSLLPARGGVSGTWERGLPARKQAGETPALPGTAKRPPRFPNLWKPRRSRPADCIRAAVSEILEGIVP